MARTGGSTPPTRQRRVRAFALAAIAVAVLVAGGLTWWLLTRDGEVAQSAAGQEQPLTEARAAELVELATSGDEAQIREAFVLPAEQPLDPALAGGLAGLDLVIDAASYASTGPDTATVGATVTGADGASTDWTLALLLTDAGWQIVHTVPQEGQE